MRSMFIVGFLSILTLTGKAQFTGIDLSAGVNYSHIGDQIDEDAFGGSALPPYVNVPITYDVEERFKGFVGSSISGKAKFSIGKKTQLRTGLGLDYIKFKRDTRILSSTETLASFTGSLGQNNDVITTDGGIIIINTNGDPENESNPDDIILVDPEKGPAHIVYLTIPIEMSYQLSSRFYSKIGISLASRIYSRTKGDVVRFDRFSGETAVEEHTYTNGKGFNENQFFASIGFGYQIAKKTSIELNYNRGLSPIFENDAQAAGKAKYNLIGLGISYQLWKVSNKKLKDF